MKTEFKEAQARNVVLYRYTCDPKVAKAGIQNENCQDVESRKCSSNGRGKTRQTRLMGQVTQGRAGISSFQIPQTNNSRKEGCRLVESEVRAAVEEMRMNQKGE